nr:T9SS type A sorting domain-containing protein [uncultured Chryseobacterium sp.]
MKLKLFLASVLVAGLMNAQVAGDYDTSFGTNGKIIETGSTNPSRLMFSKMVLQPDGKILVIARGAISGSQFNIFRYLPNGAKDTSFGTNGSVNVVFGAYTAVPSDLVLQEDGKILIGGSVYPLFNSQERHCGIVRLNSDGTSDTSFGDMGRTTFLYESRSEPMDVINKIVVQPDGKIITGGGSFDGTTNRFAVARLNANGSIDTGFGNNGKQIKLFTVGSPSSINNIKLLSNGNILLAGNVGNNFGLMKLLSNGTFDPSFNTTGTKTYTSNLTGNYSTSTFFPDNSIMFAGVNSSGQNRFYKFNADLQPDTTFGTAGNLSLNYSGSTQESNVSKLLLDNEGRVFAVASTYFPGSVLVTTIFCLTANGSLDNSFSGDGKLAINHGYSTTSPATGILQADHKLLISGYVSNDQFTSVTDGFFTRLHTQMSVLGTSETKKKVEFAVYPNPAKDVVILNHLDKTLLNENIEVVDASGKLVMKQTVQHENEKLNISHLNTGVYYIKIGNHVSKKVIKK